MTEIPEPPGSFIISSHYLPVRELFAVYSKAKNIYIDADELWQKQTLVNRTYILGANGPLTLSIPVIHDSNKNRKVKDIRICYQLPWIRGHKGALFSAYNTSPFFAFFREELFHLYDRKPAFIYDFNLSLLEFFFSKLKIKIKILNEIPTSGYKDMRPFSKLQTVRKEYQQLAAYTQVFSYKYPFCPYLSLIDKVSNTGNI